MIKVNLLRDRLSRTRKNINSTKNKILAILLDAGLDKESSERLSGIFVKDKKSFLYWATLKD